MNGQGPAPTSWKPRDLGVDGNVARPATYAVVWDKYSAFLNLKFPTKNRASITFILQVSFRIVGNMFEVPDEY